MKKGTYWIRHNKKEDNVHDKVIAGLVKSDQILTANPVDEIFAAAVSAVEVEELVLI